MSLFKELQLLDRPYVPMTIKIGGRDIKVRVRLPSAQEQDAVDAFYMDTYAKTIAEKLEIRHGRKTSERDSLRLIYEARTKAELIDQLIPTRYADIEARAYELAGIDREYELRELTRLAKDNEVKFTERAKQIDDAINLTRIEAREEIARSYEDKSVEELAKLMADININLKATTSASQSREADVLYYSVYDETGKQRLFESPEEVLEELRSEKITEIMRAVRKSIQEFEDIPFASPDDNAQDGPPSSQNGLAVDTQDGGKPTKTMRANSKQSSTHAS